MAITLSPSVQIREFDLTTVVPAVSQTPGAIAGLFRWGPLETRVLVDSEVTLRNRLGKPTNHNPETWFTTANFLGYGGQCQVVRAGDTTGNTVSVTSVTLVNGSANATMTSTTGLIAGMVLVYSANSAISPNANGKVTISAITNSTSIVLTSAPTSNTSTANLVFREDILYTAVAQETNDYTIDWDAQIVKNPTDYEVKDGTFASSVQWLSKYPGKMGNSIRVSVADTANSFSSNNDLIANAQINATATYINAVSGSNSVVITITPADTANSGNVTAANTKAVATAAAIAVGDLIKLGNSTIGQQFVKVDSIGSVTNASNVYTITLSMETTFNMSANVSSNTVERYWEFYNLIQVPPGQSDHVTLFGNTSANDELHIVVVDALGDFTGSPETVLEVYRGLSRASDAKLAGGQSNYYKTVVNNKSPYIWWANDRSTAPSNTAPFIASATSTAPYSETFVGGGDGLDENNVALGILTAGYDFFSSAEEVDIGLVMTGKARGLSVSSNTNLSTYLINNIAETRKDCVVFVSPDYELVVDNVGFEATNIISARNAMPSTSYAVFDSGYKYQYDKYNDLWRYIPLNGDIAGLCARTDQTNDPWWSPAGFNRGNIKNVGKLAWNPKQSDRDILYASGINSVASFPTLGTVLYGDKTLQGKPSAFDRINVRRLFITLEKAIATASKFTLFEFNDAFTRSQFKSMVNPYLADVKGKRGIQDFLVVCDATNNTPTVIDANQFKAAIYIKPARSINWIILDFVAVPTGVAFNEIVGRYGG